MSRTQKELEALYQKINKALAEDPAFREKVQKDARAAVEELAGRPLEEGFRLDFIEQDARYGETYVLPDFVGQELEPHELDTIAGGRNVRTVSANTCAARLSCGAYSTPCGADSSPCAVYGTPCGAYGGCPYDSGCSVFVPCNPYNPCPSDVGCAALASTGGSGFGI